MADCDDIILTYRMAVEGDENAQTDLWREFRSHMLRVIRLKAADLRMLWAVEAEDVYDDVFFELLTCETPVQFDNAYHLSCYIEKSLRRRTARTVRATSSRCCFGLGAISEYEFATDDFVEQTIHCDECAAILSKLTPRERMISELFVAGCRWHEIGMRLGLAGDTARMIFRRMIVRIRDEDSGCLLASGGEPEPGCLAKFH